jgi:hypothetical protein
MAGEEAAFGHLEDLVRHRASLIEDVEARCVRGVLAGESLRVLIFAHGRRTEPGFLAIAVIQPVRRADEPGSGDAGVSQMP